MIFLGGPDVICFQTSVFPTLKSCNFNFGFLATTKRIDEFETEKSDEYRTYLFSIYFDFVVKHFSQIQHFRLIDGGIEFSKTSVSSPTKNAFPRASDPWGDFSFLDFCASFGPPRLFALTKL